MVATARAEITLFLLDPSVQWMLFVCAGIYLIAFAVLRRRLAAGGEQGNRRWWRMQG